MITPNDKLSEIICNNIDLLPIVYRFGIKSNIGNDSIHEICKQKNINTTFFIAVLNTFNAKDYFPETADIELTDLIHFLIQTHSFYKSYTIPHLTNLVENLKKHNPNIKLAIVIDRYLKDYIKNLIQHIEFEEKEIFPLIDRNRRTEKSELIIKKLFKEHENAESEIRDLLAVIIQHIPENSDIVIIHELLHSLSHFEKEQIDHARFEDKILVPKLLALHQ